MALEPDGQIVTLAIEPDVAKAATRANDETDAVRILGTMDTVGGPGDRTEHTVQAGRRTGPRLVGSNLLFDSVSIRVVRSRLLSERRLRRQVASRRRLGRPVRRIRHHALIDLLQLRLQLGHDARMVLRYVVRLP